MSPVELYFRGYGVLRFKGSDAQRFLQGQISQDVRLLDHLSHITALILNNKGNIVSHCILLKVTNQEYFMLIPSERIEAAQARILRYLVADDVEIELITETLILFTPNTQKSPYLDNVVFETEFSIFGQTGIMTFRRGSASRPPDDCIRQNLLEVEYQRILDRFPKWGHEITEKTLPQELSNDERWFSTTKGCYVGQEVVARIHSIGQVNKRLFLFQFSSQENLIIGSKIFDHDKKEVGILTSVAFFPDKQVGVALGFLKKSAWDQSEFFDKNNCLLLRHSN